MMTVSEVSKLSGVSVRTLQYYDKIGLLHPSGYTDAGYRQYNKADLERLQQILLFRELEFPLKEIKSILDSPDFDGGRALDQQIELLTLKKEHIERLLEFALGIRTLGVKDMDFKAFDRSKLDEYAKKAKELYGNTPEYQEFQEKGRNRTAEDEKLMAEVRHILEVQMADTLKARVLRDDNTYERIDRRGKVLLCAQDTFCEEAQQKAEKEYDPKQARVFIPAEPAQ